jgi:hypothetical protein
MRALLTIVVAGIVVAATTTGEAQSASECQQLWVARNQIYKNHGYCFRTTAAADYFGNAGCHITNQDAVPITSAELAYIDRIVARERVLRCGTEPGPIVQPLPSPVPPTVIPAGLTVTPAGPTAPPSTGDACRRFPGLC